MPSSRKKTPPRLSNLKFQKHLDQMTRMVYHQSRAANCVTLATELGKTEKIICAGFLQDLSKDIHADQKLHSFLKDRVQADTPELYSIRNL